MKKQTNWNFKKAIEGINSRLYDTKECMHELEDKVMEIT